MKKTILSVLFLAIVVIGGYMLYGALTPGQSLQYSGPVESITIAEGKQPVFALLYIAEHENYFEQAGLSITFREFTSGRDALQDVVDGNADLATTYETPIVIQAYNGEKLAILSRLHSSTRNTALVARKDRGIAQPADFAGKRIAVTPNTNGEFFLQQFLTSHGIDLDTVTFVPTAPPDMASVLDAGKVDAVATWNTHLYNAEQTLNGGSQTFFSDIYTEFSVLVGLEDFVNERPEAVRRLMRALVKSQEFLEAHPEEAKNIVVSRLTDEDPETVLAVWDAASREVGLDNVMLTILGQEGRWMSGNGVVNGEEPDFRSLFADSFLREVKPDAVTIL